MPMDLPPQLHERVTCSIAAAVQYGIPANIMLAVAEKEGGKAGQWVRNANGTHDVGPLRFNTAYLRQLSIYGISPRDVATAGCYPYELAAWRLRLHIRQDAGDIWTRCANYHSRTPRFNEAYRADLIRKSERWAVWIESRFTTHRVQAGTASKARTYKPGSTGKRAESSPRLSYFADTSKVTYQPRALVEPRSAELR